MNLVNTTYNSTEDLIMKLQQLKRKTKLKYNRNISNYYNEKKHKNFQTQEDPFSKNTQNIKKIYHEVLLVMKYLQTKPEFENMDNNYYDLYYTVVKNGKEIVDDNENDYNIFNDLVTPSHYTGIKPRETKLR